MDELDALKQMRSDLPMPDPSSKERLRLRLRQEEKGGGRRRRSRAFLGLVAGLILVGSVAISPAGPAVADKMNEILGDDYSQNRELAPRIEAAIKDIKPSTDPTLTPEERFEMGNEAVDEVVREVEADAGVAPEPPLPDGVVTRLQPNPLDGLDLAEYRAFCAKVADLAPNDHSCELNFMVQNGEIRPGDYTQAQIDAALESNK